MCDMTHEQRTPHTHTQTNTENGSCVCMLSCVSHVMCESCYVCARCHARVMSCTGCRRCMGCLKLQVSFRKRATDCRAVLQKFGACAMSCVTRHAHSTRAHTHSLTRRVGLVRVSVWVCESCHSCHVTMHFSDKYIKIFVKFTMSDSQERSIHDLMSFTRTRQRLAAIVCAHTGGHVAINESCLR